MRERHQNLCWQFLVKTPTICNCHHCSQWHIAFCHFQWKKLRCKRYKWRWICRIRGIYFLCTTSVSDYTPVGFSLLVLPSCWAFTGFLQVGYFCKNSQGHILWQRQVLGGVHMLPAPNDGPGDKKMNPGAASKLGDIALWCPLRKMLILSALWRPVVPTKERENGLLDGSLKFSTRLIPIYAPTHCQCIGMILEESRF